MKNYADIKKNTFIDMIGDLIGSSKFSEDRNFIAKTTGMKINRADYEAYRTNLKSQFQELSISEALKETHAAIAKKNSRNDADYLVMRAVIDSGVEFTAAKRHDAKGALISRYEADMKKKEVRSAPAYK